jgi:quercetin dioxygenase-like cupin family protein
MKLVKVGEGTPYEAPHHFRFWGIKKINPETDSKNVTIGVSHFLPGGGAEMSSSPQERAYFCIRGNVTVKGKSGEYQLEEGDVIYIAPNEERSFQVTNTQTATLLVIMSKMN